MAATIITIVVLVALTAVVSMAAAWVTHRRWQQARQETHRLAREQQATQHALQKFVTETLPQIHQSGGRIAAPTPAPELAGTPIGEQLITVVKGTAGVVQAVVRDIQFTAHQEIEQAKTLGAEELRRSHTDAQVEIARVRSTALRSTEAAVRSVSSALVGMAAKTSRKVSEGVRAHEDDAAFETLVGIDHTVQQMLLVAQGWTVLAGGKLTRHWPTTPLTDVVRAAMGYVEDYDRVQPQELNVAVKTRVVGPVVHTLAILLDNALRFSPPQSRVHVAFEHGHHGVTVIVDDSGLQMTPEQLDAGRDILTGHRTDDITQLGARPQTGFRVAAALASAYGFRVDVQAPNSLLGTRALLTLPEDLLTTVPQQVSAPSQPAQDAPPTTLAPTPAGQPSALTPVTARPLAALAPAPAAEEAGQERPAARTTTVGGLTVRHRRSAPTPAPRPANAEPGRASVIAAWARGTERARAEQNAQLPAAETTQGHEA
ncbi:ATP-binding protein [Streptomyces albospinus]|uniref:histidine kinase n=1 Tax=Streptomyces albospinus TaxID=285515 RepID=A0ABQ2UXB9_9ACTN|nr:ATP-binding protein [Streptomyces albospinus]GGU55993.1 ATP-binding protein [Streptomyces albospinus]